MAQWLVRQGGSEPIGPVSTELVLKAIEAGRVTGEAEVCRVGTNRWLPIDAYPEFAGIVFDDQGPTNVVDSPWFANEPMSSVRRSNPRVSSPRASSPRASSPSRPSQSGLGLPPPRTGSSSPHHPLPPPPTRPPVMSQSMPRTRPSAGIAPPSRSRPQTGPTRPIGPGAGSQKYDEVDDNAATRVANPLTDHPSGASNEFTIDDETMTRVQGGRRTPGAAPQAPPRRAGGILPTLPMQSIQAALGSREGIPPRPAAGTPPPISVREDLRVPETQPLGAGPPPTQNVPGSFPPVNPTPIPPGIAGQPPHAQHGQPGVPPNPYQTSPPPYGSPGGYYPPPHGSYDPMQYPPQQSGDQGLKALVALIVFLAVALAIVLVLLFVRQ